MTSFILKLIINPIGLWLSAVLFTGLEFGWWVQPVVIGVILAVIGVALEAAALKRGTLYFSTLLDFAVTTAGVYFITPLFNGTVVTFMAALETGVLFMFVEFALHSYLIRSGKTKKAEY